MKLKQALVLSALVLFTAITVGASPASVDPRTIIVDPGTPGTACQQFGPTFTSFGIPVNPGGGGVVTCKNQSGKNWVGLDVFATVSADVTLKEFEASLICGGPSSMFRMCAVQAAPPNLDFDHKQVFEIQLFDGVIDAGSTFNIILNNAGSSVGDWGGFKHNPHLSCPTDVPMGQALCAEAVLGPTPEPGTLTLFATGLGIFWLRRKRMVRRTSE